MGRVSYRMLVGLIALMAFDSGAVGQCTNGEFRTANGNTVTWTHCSFSYSWSPRGVWGYRLRMPWYRVIEGPDVELVDSDGLDPEHPNGKFVRYLPLDRARDLMGGRTRDAEGGSPKRGTWGLLHQCDNDECALKLASSVVNPSRDDAQEATQWYLKYLKENPDDWIVIRELALAYALAKEFGASIDLLKLVYSENPDMGSIPIDGEFMGQNGRILREMVVQSVKYAYREPSAEAWLLVTVLMQSEDRLERAAEMLQKSVDLGLDGEIATGLFVALP